MADIPKKTSQPAKIAQDLEEKIIPAGDTDPLPKKTTGIEEKKLVQENNNVWEAAREKAEMGEKTEAEKNKLPEKQEADIIGALRNEIKEMQLEPSLVKEAEKKEKKIEFLGQKGKLEQLMRLANEKGVEFAVKVAKNMGDPYILDLFHDLLIKEGFYRNILNQVAQPSVQPASDDATQPPAAIPAKPMPGRGQGQK
jgi:hypothetical protein